MHQLQPLNFQRSRASISCETAGDDSLNKRQLFLTQRNIEAQMAEIHSQAKAADLQFQSNLNKIQESHNQLNRFLEQLDDRVKEVMDHNEAEILCAYKNHVFLVKRQMEELRRQSQAQANSSSSHLERIQELQKKLAIFREQSLILFRKVIQRDKVIEQLKVKIGELQNEKLFMNQSLKGCMQRNKELEVQVHQNKGRAHIAHNQDDYTQKFDVSMLCINNIKGKVYRHKNRTALTSVNLSKGATTNTQNCRQSNSPKRINISKYEQFSHSHSKKFAERLRLKLDYLMPQLQSQVVQTAQMVYSQIERQNSERLQGYLRQKEVLSRATKISVRSKSNYTMDYDGRPLTASSLSKQRVKQETYQRQKDLTAKNEMSEYFVQCIEVIKKEIIRKKNMNSLNFYKQGNPINLKEFKKLDWFKLMQLFLTEEKVVEELYKILIIAKIK